MSRTAARVSVQIQAKLFRSLADPSRLTLLTLLCQSAHTVSQLVAASGLTQSNISNHLACLRDCGLIQAERSGKQVTYCLCTTGIADVLHAADAVLAQTGQAIAACSNYSPTNAVGGVA